MTIIEINPDIPEQDDRPKDRLDHMMNMQKALQLKVIGEHPQYLPHEGRVQYINVMMLAVQDELHEALRETPWKPWSKNKTFNRDKYVDELVDAWHLFMNLLLVADVDADEFYVKYVQKNLENHKRADTGYSSTTG